MLCSYFIIINLYVTYYLYIAILGDECQLGTEGRRQPQNTCILFIYVANVSPYHYQ